MSDFVIIPDSTSDFTADLRERFGVPEVIKGLIYFPDGHTEAADLDWEKHTPEEYYKSMTDKTSLYTTATAHAGDIKDTFEKYLKEGKDIITVSLSAALSGTNALNEMVKKELLEKYPDRKIFCVDTNGYSAAIALLIIGACELKAQGATVEEVAKYFEDNKFKVHQMGTMDDLFFLVKKGRISNFKAFFGSLIGINTVADFNRGGLPQVLHKFKGKKDAFAAVVEYIKETIIDAENQIIIVAHTNRFAAAQKLAEIVKAELNPKEIIIKDVGMSCGANIGPGLCAAYYFGKELTEDMVYEEKLMQDIAENLKKKG